jgi:transcriptional regulator with XRE-family HTH domain
LLVKTRQKAYHLPHMGNQNNTPFVNLGSALRTTRLTKKESILEVSSAVEITGERLALFENGELRPSEDVLELLIAHYALADKEADRLWDLAGYKKQEDISQQPFTMVQYDNRIAYTDMVHVMVNNYGVVMNFMQGAGPQAQPITVSRIGMSREHARSVLEVLQKTLEQADGVPKEPRRLDAPDATNAPE